MTFREDEKRDLQQICEEKLEGNIIRSRAQWHQEGEKPSKFFCNLESYNYTEKTVKRLICGSNIIANQKEILLEIQKFYKNLFKCNNNNLSDSNLDEIFQNLNGCKKLSPEDAKVIEGLLTITEIGNALKSMKNGKCPGTDGFPAKF